MKTSIFLKDKKNILAASVLGAIVVASVGGGIYFSNKKETEKKTDTPTTAEQVDLNIQKKEDSNSNTREESNTNSSGNTAPAPAQQQNQADLSDITLQATISENNEIKLFLYGQSGAYKIQRQGNGTWITVIENGVYSGRGGFEIVESIPSDVSTRTYRVFRIVEGKESQPKDILIDRSVIIKRGGVTNFPEAQ